MVGCNGEGVLIPLVDLVVVGGLVVVDVFLTVDVTLLGDDDDFAVEVTADLAVEVVILIVDVLGWAFVDVEETETVGGVVIGAGGSSLASTQ